MDGPDSTIAASKKYKTIARDILLAIVPLGVAQGYSMSGLPPTIVGACICWGLTAMLALHAAWIGLPIKKRPVRAMLLIASVGILIWALWNPVTVEYRKEHPNSAPEIATKNAPTDATTSPDPKDIAKSVMEEMRKGGWTSNAKQTLPYDHPRRAWGSCKPYMTSHTSWSARV